MKASRRKQQLPVSVRSLRNRTSPRRDFVYAEGVLPTSAVVVCAHDLGRLGLTIRCVHSVLDGDLQPDEIFVVVDNNERLHGELQKALIGVGARVVRNPGSGPAAARSAAVDLATAEVCLFIDDDARAERNWLRNMVAVFGDARIAGAGGRVIPEWGDGAIALPSELLWVVGATYRGHPEGEVPITRPIGANMAARTSVVRDVGGFPSGFGPRGGKKVSSNEELALYTAITERCGSASVVFVPTSVVHHYVPAGRTTWAYLFERCWAEGSSKADVRTTFHGTVLAHDRAYARSTLIPAIGRYLWRSLCDRDVEAFRSGAQCATSLGVTACAYASRRLGLV